VVVTLPPLVEAATLIEGAPGGRANRRYVACAVHCSHTVDGTAGADLERTAPVLVPTTVADAQG
jgi:hypothetical protein